MAACTCEMGSTGPITAPRDCAHHRDYLGAARLQAATPAPEGVPIVDLTRLVDSLYTQADDCREHAATVDAVAASQRRQADLLESLAAVLSGGVREE